MIFLNIFLSALLFFRQRNVSLKLLHKVQASEFSSINIDAGRCAAGCFLSPLYLVQHINERPMKHHVTFMMQGKEREKKKKMETENVRQPRGLKPVWRERVSQIFSTPVSFGSSSKHFFF